MIFGDNQNDLVLSVNITIKSRTADCIEFENNNRFDHNKYFSVSVLV